uniref:Uncharacterized protein n=1 Tax=Ixodes ricinus TaxID=34613 RepID=A0A6B0UM62_IXORI
MGQVVLLGPFLRGRLAGQKMQLLLAGALGRDVRASGCVGPIAGRGQRSHRPPPAIRLFDGCECKVLTRGHVPRAVEGAALGNRGVAPGEGGRRVADEALARGAPTASSGDIQLFQGRG